MSASSSSSPMPSSPQQPSKAAVVAPRTPVIMTAELNTPPSSPAGLHNGGFRPFHFRQNAFAQWAGPLSPTLTARSIDEESEVGFSDHDDGASSTASRSPSPPRFEPPTTPKGHPLENSRSLLWGHHFSNHARAASTGAAAAVGLGLGLGQLDAGERAYDLNDDPFESRERERKAGKVLRPSASLAAFEQPKTWPKIRISRRSRPALYFVGCILSLLIYVLAHRPPTLPASPAPSPFDSYRLAPRSGTTASAIVDRRAKSVRAEQQVLAQPADVAAGMAEKWIWASRDEELAALLNYIISAEANHIPAVDASVQLDPSLLLDFDPYSRQANNHLTELQHNLWNDYPVIVFAKQRNAHTRFIRSELDRLFLQPRPFYIDTDARADTDILAGLLDRLVGRSDLPLVLVGGSVVGGWAELDTLVKAGQLTSRLADAGAISAPPKKKKAKKAGHGGKTEEQLAAAIEAEKRTDEERRRRAEDELELARLQQLALEAPVEIPIDDASDPETY